MTLILLYVRDYEAKIGGDQTFRRFFVPGLSASGESTLFFSVGDQGKLLNVLEILVECGGGGGTEEAFGSTFARCLHKPLVRSAFL
jgi:hypothetical protein